MATPVHHGARSENSSEAAALNGHKAKTPIIAGSVSGACVLLAWTIGFIIFFVRRRNQKKRAKELGYKSHRDIIDSFPAPNPTTFIIPPDPALVGTQELREQHVRDLERQVQIGNPPPPKVRVEEPQASDQSEQGTVRSPDMASRTNSTTYSTPMITTTGPSTIELSTVESNYPMLESSSRLPSPPLARKIPGDRKR